MSGRVRLRHVSMIMQWIPVTPAEASSVTAMSGDTFFEWLEEHDDQTVEVDKAWHAIHAVLTGSAWDVSEPLSTLVLGGTEFGEDVGYGPPRLLGPTEVGAAADAVRDVSVYEFRQRIDFGKLKQLDVYPAIWDRTEEHEELVGYLTHGFEAVRALFLEAAARNDAMVVDCT